MDAALAPETGLLAEMVRLRESGKIGRVGLGMNANLRPDLILRLLREAPAGTFDTALLAGKSTRNLPVRVSLWADFDSLLVVLGGWNLLGQDSLPILGECERLGIVSAQVVCVCLGALGAVSERMIVVAGSAQRGCLRDGVPRGRRGVPV